jgi:hypothetical protein
VAAEQQIPRAMMPRFGMTSLAGPCCIDCPAACTVLNLGTGMPRHPTRNFNFFMFGFLRLDSYERRCAL